MATLNKARFAAIVCAYLLSRAVGANTFVLPSNDIDLVGTSSTVQSRYEDTLIDIARNHDLGYTEMVRANPGVDSWLPGEGTEILLPKQFILPSVERRGIVINLPEMRIFYYPKPSAGRAPVVMTHPISIGRMDWTTPLGQTHIISKIKNPDWYPPESIREEHAADGDALPLKVPSGPDNPLGVFAMQLSIPGYLIHGTNKPWGIGMRITHGCIRMLPEDIEPLYRQVPVNTPVRIINMPIKVGWLEGRLYLEVHSTLDDDETNQQKGMTRLVEQLITATRDRHVKVNWETIENTYRRATGVPIQISVPDIHQ